MSRRASIATLLAALGVTLVGVSPARATLAEALDLPTLVSRSDDVVVGRVVARGSRWLRQRIVTEVTVVVSEAPKGDVAAAERIEVTVFGGAVGDLGMQIAGEAVLEDGEEYLLFLRRWNGTRRPVGMAQGALPITRRDGQLFVQPGAGGLALVRRDATGAMAPAEPAVTEPTLLEALLDEIRALAD
jgi:hypothetical protein